MENSKARQGIVHLQDVAQVDTRSWSFVRNELDPTCVTDCEWDIVSKCSTSDEPRLYDFDVGKHVVGVHGASRLAMRDLVLRGNWVSTECNWVSTECRTEAAGLAVNPGSDCRPFPSPLLPRHMTEGTDVVLQGLTCIGNKRWHQACLEVQLSSNVSIQGMVGANNTGNHIARVENVGHTARLENVTLLGNEVV